MLRQLRQSIKTHLQRSIICRKQIRNDDFDQSNNSILQQHSFLFYVYLTAFPKKIWSKMVKSYSSS